MMESLSWWMASNAVMATALALIAWLVTQRTSRPALIYACWALVLIKLVTPPLWSIPVDWPMLADAEQRPAAAAPAVSPGGDRLPAAVHSTDSPAASDTARSSDGGPDIWLLVPVELDGPADGTTSSDRDGVVEASGGGSHEAAVAGGRRGGAASSIDPVAAGADRAGMLSPRVLLTYLLVVWFAGVVLLALMLLLRSTRFARLLQAARPAPESIRREVVVVSRRVGLRRAPDIRIVPARISPMVWFWGWRPVLVLPERLLSAIDSDQRTTLIAHELAHVRRKDHWMRMLELAATTIYWWHPVAWWARTQLRQAEETRCDAWVVQQFPQLKRAYLEAILNVIDFLAGAFPPMPALASGFGRAAIPLQRRLEMMIRRDTGQPLSWLGRLVIAALAVGILPWAAGAADEPSKRTGPDDDAKPSSVKQQADDDDDDAPRDRPAARSIREYVMRLAMKLDGDDDDDDDGDDDDDDHERRRRGEARRHADHDRPHPPRDRKGPPRRPRGERPRHDHPERHPPEHHRGERHHGEHADRPRHHDEHEGDHHAHGDHLEFRFHVDGKEFRMPEQVREQIEQAIRGGKEARRRMMIVMPKMQEMGRNMGKIAHLSAAAHHLHAAGMHEMAERVEQELREVKESMEHHEHGDRGHPKRGERRVEIEIHRGPGGPEGPPHGPPHGPPGPPRGPRADGPPGPPHGEFRPGPPPEVREMIERKRDEIQREVRRRMEAWRKGSAEPRRRPDHHEAELDKVLRDLHEQMRELRRELEELKRDRRR